jgi:hypothetical protein
MGDVCLKKMLYFGKKATGCQGIHQGSLFVLLKSQYPETTGYWMPRHKRRLFVCFVKLAVSWNDRLPDAKAYTKAVCLFCISRSILE